VNTLIQVAVESMRATFDAYGHTLTLNLAAQPVFIDGDSVRLTQVLVNLLSNAAKYTAPNGQVEVSVGRDHSVVRIEVSDNGIGMSPTLIERAFEPFVQGERAVGRSEGGLGIGLTLVKKIIDLHGGSVVASSAGAHRGTKFTVTLPLTTERSQPLAVVEAAAPPDSGTILVVDDNQDAAESLVALLQASGRDVLVAFSGREALEIAATRPLAAVLLDIGLPDVSGYELARRLRAMPALHNARMIATTGYGQERDREASAAAGFNAHLVKPIDHEEVLRLIG
jgi:hypothetical protein